MTDELRECLRDAVKTMNTAFVKLTEFISQAEAVELYNGLNKEARKHYSEMRKYQQLASTQGILLERALDD